MLINSNSEALNFLQTDHVKAQLSDEPSKTHLGCTKRQAWQLLSHIFNNYCEESDQSFLQACYKGIITEFGPFPEK